MFRNITSALHTSSTAEVSEDSVFIEQYKFVHI